MLATVRRPSGGKTALRPVNGSAFLKLQKVSGYSGYIIKTFVLKQLLETVWMRFHDPVECEVRINHTAFGVFSASRWQDGITMARASAGFESIPREKKVSMGGRHPVFLPPRAKQAK
ncbi:MAG: hypothetical protein M0Z32_04935 [Actinomycetota bacterium]|jgi:hypothetical protein|nr:hypothetical protein [Actinomycetota bacterium]MCL6094160.1 hypothetical protein [Actinomycetota bacterium]MDA8167083.1 hypothetical protein [Actinomycetota bacterium]